MVELCSMRIESGAVMKKEWTMKPGKSNSLDFNPVNEKKTGAIDLTELRNIER